MWKNDWDPSFMISPKPLTWRQVATSLACFTPVTFKTSFSASAWKFKCFIAENFRFLKQQFTVFKLHHQNFFQKPNFLILEETERSSYLFLFCALQPSRYLPQEIKVIILASISNSECSDTGLFWLRMWVFSEMINGYYRWIQKIFSNRKWAEMHRTPQWYI